MSSKIKPTDETWTDRTGKVWPVFVAPEDEQPKLVKFGRGGMTIEYSRNHRLEGYDDPEDFFQPSRWWTHDHAERRDAAQFEGVAWIDMRDAAGTDAGYHMAISGPMVDVDLEAGAVDQLQEPDRLFAGAMEGTSYGGLLALHKEQRKAGKVGALDCVDLATYCAMWRDAGAKVGRIHGGQFVECTV